MSDKAPINVAMTSASGVTIFEEWDMRPPVTAHAERIYQAWLSGRQRLEFRPDGRASLLPPYARWICPKCKMSLSLDIESCAWCEMEASS